MLNIIRIHRNMFWEHLTLPKIGNSVSDLQIQLWVRQLFLETSLFFQASLRRPFGSPNTLRLVVAKPPAICFRQKNVLQKKNKKTKAGKTYFLNNLSSHNHRFSLKSFRFPPLHPHGAPYPTTSLIQLDY